MTTIPAKKIEMTQVFEGDRVLPVTILSVGEADETAFEEGELLRITGTSKGKGFQGVVKRHGFAGGPKTHGQKNRHRAPGSIGPTGPQRVIPGRRMAGRMGGDTVTVKKVRVVGWSAESRKLSVKGPVPGRRGSTIRIRRAEGPASPTVASREGGSSSRRAEK